MHHAIPETEMISSHLKSSDLSHLFSMLCDNHCVIVCVCMMQAKARGAKAFQEREKEAPGQSERAT